MSSLLLQSLTPQTAIADQHAHFHQETQRKASVMSNPSTPSPIPFLILGLVTGGALLYVSYWVWPPAQRRSNKNHNSGRRTLPPTRSSQTSSSRQREPTVQRSAPARQPRAARRADNRHYQSEGSSSDGGFEMDSDEDDEDEDASDREPNMIDQDGYEKLPIEDIGDKHDGLQLMNLLYAIAEDQAGKEGHIHRGITCNSCQTVPIRGLRYKCANCQDYDLCEGCEAAEVHTKSHVFMKIRIPIPPLANSRTKKLAPFYPGIPQGSTTTPDHMLQDLLKKTHFDNVELDAMYNQYLSLSTLDQEGGGITRLTFEQALGPLGLEKNLITERIFQFFDQDDDGTINFTEMACGLSVLCKGNFDEKIDFAFQGYDLDGDGYISREELHEMFKAYFYLSMELIRDVVKTMENDLMNNFEYQPGMPISSTFTAPIPREIGVRNNNNGNGNGGNEDRRHNREQAPLPAEWSLSVIPSEAPSSVASVASPSMEGISDLTAQTNDREPVAEAEDKEDEKESIDEDRAQEAGPDDIRPTIADNLPSGAYGLVGEDAFAQDEDDGQIDSHDSETESEVGSLAGSTTESLLSPGSHHSLTGHVSEAEDSGVDSSVWVPGVHQNLGQSSIPQSVPDSPLTDDGHQPAIVPDPESLSSGLPLEEPIPTPMPRVLEGSTPSTNTTTVSGESTESTGPSNSRPRKDQPLPRTTASPHLTPSHSNPNLTWDRHQRTNTASSLRHPHPSPSLAPAFAIGFGLTEGPSASSSPPSLAGSSSSAFMLHNREIIEPGLEHISDASAATLPSSLSVPEDGLRNGAPYRSYASSSSAPTGSYANASYFSSTFPVMESISQDAIQEMVDKTFQAIKNPSKPGFITLEEFRAYVLTDAGVLGWFDALGSIF